MATIRELIDALEDYAERHGDDREVRFMSQPNYPFEYSITAAVSSEAIKEWRTRSEGKDGEEDDEDDEDGVIYLLEGDQLGYADKDAWEAMHDSDAYMF